MQPLSHMRVVSVNVGLPREVLWKRRIVLTGIFKEPVVGRVKVRRLNLDGDRQADLSVHGGPEKAVYVYPADYYQAWRKELPEMEIPWAMFGENLTVEGLRDDTVHIGDQFRIGSALFEVTQPRMPCFKLALRFGRDDIIKRFLANGRTGFYFAVLEEGEVAAGDPIMLVNRDEDAITVAEITRLYNTCSYYYFVSFSEDETFGFAGSARARERDPGTARGAPADARKAASFVSQRGGKTSPAGRGSCKRCHARKL